MVALSYSGRKPDVRRARLVREKQSRETATGWNAASHGTWTPPYGLTNTVQRFEDLTEQSDVEAQVWNIPSSRKSARRHGSRRDKSSPTGSRNQSPNRSRSRSPHKDKSEETGGWITRTLSGLFSSAQEAIGASWAAPTAEVHDTNTSDSREYPVSYTHLTLPTICSV